MRPVVGPDSPLRVRGVVRISSQPGGELEKTSIRDGVFVAVPVVERVDLPPQATATGGGIPPESLGVEDGLGESKPLSLVSGRVGEVLFGGGYDGEAPEALVVVSLSPRGGGSAADTWIQRDGFTYQGL